ncbi:MAG TPA: YeeE/YedE family protein [Bacillota bacterium]
MTEWHGLMLLGGAFGLVYGFLLQRGDMCFTSAFRDWYAFRDTRVLRGIVAALLVAWVGWGLALTVGWAGQDRLWLPPVGWNSFIGAFIFGIGMYLAGACASGALYRCGMGYLQFWLTLVAMGLGYYAFFLLFDPVLKPYYFDALRISEPLTLYRLVPLPPLVTALLVVAAVVGGISARIGPAAVGQHLREVVAFLRQPPARLLRLGAWDSRAVGVLLGLTVTVQFSLWSIWGITGAEARLTALAWQRLTGAEVAANSYVASLFAEYPGLAFGPDEVLILAIVAGAALSAWLGGTFRVRRPRWRRLPNALLGGFLLGFGSRLAPGCNVGNIISGLPALSLHSIIATLGIAAGIYVAWSVAHARPARAPQGLALATVTSLQPKR